MSLRALPVLAVLLSAACVSRDAPARDSLRGPTDSVATISATGVPDSTSEQRSAARWVVSPRGIGPVLAGMSLDALGTALGEPLKATYGAGSSCAYLHPVALPEDVLVMVQHDTVVRVDVRRRGVLTAEGAGVGDAEASVVTRYEGRLRITPHKYTGPTGHYLTVTAPPDSAHAIVFETDGSTVLTYRAGRRDAVALVEGCS
jgi:hypothetical protein